MEQLRTSINTATNTMTPRENVAPVTHTRFQRTPKAANQIRQGDVFFRAIDTLPVEAEAMSLTGDVHLMEAKPHEAHGSHTIVNDANVSYYSHTAEGKAVEYISTPHTISVDHPEHGAIHLHAGTWKVCRQQRLSNSDIVKTTAALD